MVSDLENFKIKGLTANGDMSELDFRVDQEESRRLLIRINDVEYDVQNLEATLEYAKKIWLS